MNKFLATLTVATCVVLTAQAPAGHAQGATDKAGKKVVFACNMNAMTKEQRKRQSQFLTPALHAQRFAASEVADGYELQFPSDAHTLQLLAEWIGNERLCCPFFNFDVKLTEGPAPMILKISGPEGVKQFIRAELPALVG